MVLSIEECGVINAQGLSESTVFTTTRTAVFSTLRFM
jgi:hypothetical protein